MRLWRAHSWLVRLCRKARALLQALRAGHSWRKAQALLLLLAWRERQRRGCSWREAPVLLQVLRRELRARAARTPESVRAAQR